MTDIRIKGVYQSQDFADKVQNDYVDGIDGGDSCGWWHLEDIYRVKRGLWTAVSGIPGHGKSTWLDNLKVNLAMNHGWKHLVCSPENQPIERHIESLIEIYMGKKFDNPNNALRPDQCLTPEEVAQGLAFVQAHFQFISPEETDFHIGYILQLAEEVHAEWKFDGFLLDPYNELEPKRPAQMNETEYISLVLGKFRRFCRKQNVHGWLVAHPTKLKEIPQQTEVDGKKPKIYGMPSLYDIAGSANWRNKADNGVVVYRDFTQQPEKTIVAVQKIRFRECGRLGQAEFYFDTLCNRFVEKSEDLLFYRTRQL